MMSDTQTTKPRIGIVGYLNARPLTDRIDRSRYEVVADHPASIAEMLDSGEVDVGLVPVAAILDGTHRILPGTCIGAEGEVASVLLVGETPPEQWERIVLDGVSRTSAVLTRVLLAGPLGDRIGEVEVVQGAPLSGVESARGTTAGLVIGDRARTVPAHLCHRVDLAEAWTEWTGLPFVFAVWAGRRDLDADLRYHLRVASAEGLAAIESEYSGSEKTYLTENIRYPLDDRALMGLRRFAALAAAGGWVPAELISLFPPADPMIPRLKGVDEILLRASEGEAITASDAERLEVGASLSDLAAAAHLRRMSLHGDEVRWRAAWKMDDPSKIDEAVAAGVTAVYVPPEVPGEALEQMAVQHPGLVVLREPEGAVQVIGRGESGRERVAELVSLRQRKLPWFRCEAAFGDGAAAEEANTAIDHLRATALARLVLSDVPSLHAASASEGIGMAAASLHMGCDHFGDVFYEGDGFAAVTKRVERAIRDAGFTPVRV
jgi:chorismate dehydratase